MGVQGLPDHAHVPTLRQLPKELPVVASPAAARIAADLGFKRVYELDHGQEMLLADGRLRIKATAGAAPVPLRSGSWSPAALWQPSSPSRSGEWPSGEL